jgi:serine-type D-Ala-D-Ala carboxypeptidase (penicillin-binding protein 5/6)
MIAAALLSIGFVAASLVPPVPMVAPMDEPGAPPQLESVAWAIYDESADVKLASWNANRHRAIASVTKVLTAMVVLDEASLDEVVTIPKLAVNGWGSTAGLVAGEQWTVYELLVAMLVRSGNDAAMALAWHVGDHSVEAFVDQMNRKATELGMADSHFVNPNGLDEDGHYSTANDLLTLTLASLDYDLLYDIAGMRLVQLPEDPTGKRRLVKNTNLLLGAYPGVVGLKTGDTPMADRVLLSVAQRGDRRLVGVVMGTDDHFRDSRAMLEWGFSTYGLRDRWLRPFFSEQGGGGSAVPGIELSEGEQRRLAAMPALDNGRWRRSALVDLPKGALIGDWLKGTVPVIPTDEPDS